MSVSFVELMNRAAKVFNEQNVSALKIFRVAENGYSAKVGVVKSDAWKHLLILDDDIDELYRDFLAQLWPLDSFEPNQMVDLLELSSAVALVLGSVVKGVYGKFEFRTEYRQFILQYMSVAGLIHGDFIFGNSPRLTHEGWQVHQRLVPFLSEK